jgi:hypothetical protein
MRTLRIVLGTVGTMPALAVALIPAAGGCGRVADESGTLDASFDVTVPSESDAGLTLGGNHDSGARPGDAGVASCPNGSSGKTFMVDLPPPGVMPDTSVICAVNTSPVISNAAARVTLLGFVADGGSTKGHIAVAPSTLGSVLGTPQLTITSVDVDASAAFVTNIVPVSDGFTFDIALPLSTSSGNVVSFSIKVIFLLDCGKATPVESTTTVDLCWKRQERVWVSSGDLCTDCVIIAEMAPSPIPSDNRGDELPLGRVVRLRVVELATSGRMRLLFAENDAGDGARYEWRVSAGSIHKIADDIVLWTLAEDFAADEPFGQVGVWNDDGAAVENFYVGAA